MTAPSATPPPALTERPALSYAASRPPVTPVRRLHALTALRFIAAAMIVLYHSPEHLMLPPGAVIQSVNLSQAVSFFFVLSGFILTYVYPRLDTWSDRGRFLFARFCRVWPAHLVTFLLVIAFLHRFNRLTLSSWHQAIGLGAINLTLLQSWFPYGSQYFSYNSVSWSISTEFAFYLFFPFLIYRWEKTWWWKLPLTFALAAAMIAISLLAHLPPYRPNGEGLHEISSASLVYINPLSRLFEFTLGMTTALFFRAVAPRYNPRKLLGTILEIAAFALVYLNMRSTNYIGNVAYHQSWLGEPGATWLKLGGVDCFSFAILVFFMAAEWGWLSFALSAPLGILLGEISFSVYLTHQILLREYFWKFQIFGATSPWIRFPLYCLLVLILSHLIWAAVERPLRTGLLSLWPKRRDPNPAHRAAEAAGEGKHALQRVLETPAGMSKKEAARPSLFKQLLNPTPKVILIDLLLLALLWTPIYIRSFSWQWREQTPDETALLATPLQNSLVHDLHFGDTYVLHAARIDRSPEGYAKIILVWEATKDTQLRHRVAIRLIKGDLADPKTVEIPRDYPQDLSESHIHANQLWMDQINFFPADVQGVTQVAIALYREGDILPIAPAPDAPASLDHSGQWDGRRLLLPMPPPPPAKKP